MNVLKYVVFGIIIGVSNVIPGVSGGTMAIILNIYDKLMELVTLNISVIKKNLSFIIPLLLGVAVGIVGFSKLMKLSLQYYPTQTFFCFIGIVLGSLPLILHKAKQHESIQTKGYIAFICALGIMIALSFTNGDKESAKELIKYTSLNVTSFIVIFLSMAIAAATMIVPGISGSLILIIIGTYGTIYGYIIAEFYIPLLIPAGLGAVFGLIGGAKLIKYMLHKYHQLTYCIILGLLIGSLFELYKQSGIIIALNTTFITSFIMMFLLMGMVYYFSKQEIKRDTIGG
ncbi:DUF368 domain-containing protein [Erysipelotrichaceae bacterium OH741_COT-311]|nr:DUF368 domain-containing protein [Erysipelotrichaceae bacterium OH741_COT-311]